MKPSNVLLSLSMSTWLATASFANPQGHLVAYALVNSPADVDVLNNELHQMLSAQSHLSFDQLDLSFLSPTMNPSTINADIAHHDLAALLDDSFFAVDAGPTYASPAATPAQGAALKSLVDFVKSQGATVYFSVGGWAYSNPTAAHSTTFPLTSDIFQALQTYQPAAAMSDFQANGHTALDGNATNALTDTWFKVAEAFGATGIDLDYEEQWFTAQAQQKWPDPVPNHGWSFRNNYATIKYAAYIHVLEQSAAALGADYRVSIAAPSIGAFDVNSVVANDPFAGNFFYPAGSAAPLKGVIYNMNHVDEAGLSALSSIFTFQGKNILDQLASVGIMSYDLDDGTVPLQSYWCIGWLEGDEPHAVARDPLSVGAHANVSCSIYDQTLAITKMYNQLGIQAPVNAGIEAYYPNYPIDPNVTDSGSNHYRWNDAFVAFDLPLQQAPALAGAENQPFSVAQRSDKNPVPEDYQHFWLLPKQLAADVRALNHQNGFIFWSINNAKKQYLDKDKADLQAADFGRYGQSMDFVKALLSQAEDWSDTLADRYGAYHG